MVSANYSVIYADPHLYAAHPHAVGMRNGHIAVVFNRSPRRAYILHPSRDPCFESLVVVTGDEGRAWTALGNR